MSLKGDRDPSYPESLQASNRELEAARLWREESRWEAPSSGMKLSTGSSFRDTGTSGITLSSDGERDTSSIFTSILVWLPILTGISSIRGLVYTWSNLMSSLMASSLADGDPKEEEGEAGMELVSPQISSSSFSRHVDSESAYLRNISGSRLSRKPNRRSDCRMKYCFRKSAHYCYSRTSVATSINLHLEVKTC